eukprot:IDg21416t1
MCERNARARDAVMRSAVVQCCNSRARSAPAQSRDRI